MLPEDGADRITFAECRRNLDHFPAARRGHIHRRLVGFHFDDVLVRRDHLAGLDQKIDNGCLGDGLAQLGHDDGQFFHVTFATGCARRRRCSARSGGEPTIDRGGREWACLWR